MICAPPIGWHMRAGAWSTTRDIAAAIGVGSGRASVADALPADDADRDCDAHCAAHPAVRERLPGPCRHLRRPASTSCGSCARPAGDKASLAIGMAGLVPEHMFHGRVREASRLASETMALVESIGDPTLTVGLSFTAINAKIQTGEMAEALRWSQTVIDLADGDPTKGNIIFGSPLALALAARGTARWALGRAGWRDDYDRALAMARSADPMSHAMVITFTYGGAIPAGVLLADDAALRDIEEALGITERSSEDFALGLARLGAGHCAGASGFLGGA